jgi:hypothetical protein
MRRTEAKRKSWHRMAKLLGRGFPVQLMRISGGIKDLDTNPVEENHK